MDGDDRGWSLETAIDDLVWERWWRAQPNTRHPAGCRGRKGKRLWPTRPTCFDCGRHVEAIADYCEVCKQSVCPRCKHDVKHVATHQVLFPQQPVPRYKRRPWEVDGE